MLNEIIRIDNLNTIQPLDSFTHSQADQAPRPTYTVSGTSTEGDVGKGVSLVDNLRQEAVRVKLFWIWELIWVAVEGVGQQHYIGAGRDCVPTWKNCSTER